MPVFANGSSAVTSTGFTGRLSSIACKSAGMPSFFSALMRTAPVKCKALSASPTRSHLLSTGITGRSPQPRLCKISFVTSKCVRASGLEASHTFKMMSAVAACSNVERNASTKWCGKRRTRPTVSMSITVLPPGSFNARAVGSSVAKSLSSAKTPACVKRFIKVDLPAFV